MFFLDCWSYEPDNRPTINQVVSKLNSIVLKNHIIINDFQSYDSHTNIQLSSKQQLTFEDPNNNSLELSQIIQKFNNMDKIESYNN